MHCQLYVPATFSHAKNPRYPVTDVVEALNLRRSV